MDRVNIMIMVTVVINAVAHNLNRHHFEIHISQDWSLDDVLLWLQHCKLDDVASVMIGYDITGADVEQWNLETLEQLGVTDAKTRAQVLHELRSLKEHQANPSDETGDRSGTKIAKKGKPRVPLFRLVRSTSYDKVVAVETPLTTRDITVAEGRFGCLQVTKVNGANIPLKEQDWYVSATRFLFSCCFFHQKHYTESE
ncbi:unnamed protein product [Gongylonema pulchrum]|uniref:SAM domain-containing protein n=1 Tax=Gongylonema pulchrum TaxID=637853 RepID=A0A183ECT5_9BILA|nr:unnamed protein product [Gongylonema pulchrum]